MPRTAVRRTAGAVLATCALAISATAVAPAAASSTRPSVKLPSRAYRAHDYAHGRAMSILPPGENGLVTGPQLIAYEANHSNRPPHSQAELAKYENLLYGYHGLTDSKLSKYYNDESFGVRP